jgi:hypothetical protein
MSDQGSPGHRLVCGANNVLNGRTERAEHCRPTTRCQPAHVESPPGSSFAAFSSGPSLVSFGTHPAGHRRLIASGEIGIVCPCTGSLPSCQATAPHGEPNTTAAVCGKRIRKRLSTKKKPLGSRPSVPRLGWYSYWGRNPCDSRPAAWHVAAFRPKSLCRPGWSPQTAGHLKSGVCSGGEVSSQMGPWEGGGAMVSSYHKREFSWKRREKSGHVCCSRCLLLRRTGSRREPWLASVGCRPPAASRGLPRPTRCAKQSTVCPLRTNFRGPIPRRALR